MTNFEKWRDRIIEIENDGKCVALVSGVPERCDDVPCRFCDFHDVKYCGGCGRQLILWLYREYEEPKITIPKGTPVDTKVLVSLDGKDWAKRHYAGIDEDGNHCVWIDGSTSWSEDATAPYPYMKLADLKELMSRNRLTRHPYENDIGGTMTNG